jgi:hypothetical protein
MQLPEYRLKNNDVRRSVERRPFLRARNIEILLVVLRTSGHRQQKTERGILIES